MEMTSVVPFSVDKRGAHQNMHPYILSARIVFAHIIQIQNGIPSSVCAFLVKIDGKDLLFDAANGAPDSRLMNVIDSCGVTADAVDYIFITHMHGDHIGGLIKDGEAAFPNAELYINKVEYDAWMQNPQASLLARKFCRWVKKRA